MSPLRRLHRSPLRTPGVTALALVAGMALLGSAPAHAAERGDLPVAAGSGLRAGEAAWPRWQGRLSITSGSSGLLAHGRQEPNFSTDTAPLQSLSLLGDYYFIQQGLAPSSQYSGGFRASGGLIVGARRAAAGSILPAGASGLGSGFSAERRLFSLSAPAAALDGGDGAAQSVPYLGVGYTGLQSLRGTGGGWGFSADVGVMALQPRSAVRLGQESVSDTVRGLDISPVVQVGVSYSF